MVQGITAMVAVWAFCVLQNVRADVTDVFEFRDVSPAVRVGVVVEALLGGVRHGLGALVDFECQQIDIFGERGVRARWGHVGVIFLGTESQGR